MNKKGLDIMVMIIAFAAGFIVSLLDNPLTGSVILLATIIAWEVVTRVRMEKSSDEESVRS